MPGPRPSSPTRTVAMSVALACVLAALAGAAACSFIVGDNLPPFTCSPGPKDACPRPQVCAPVGTMNKCMPPCVHDGCPANYQCDDAAGLCLPITDAAGAETSTEADGTTDASLDVLADMDAGTAIDAQRTDADGAPRPGDAEAGLGSPDACASGAIGCACSTLGTTAECESMAFCVDWQAVTGGSSSDAGAPEAGAGDGGGPRFCTKACCTSNDCDRGSVCFATGAGGNYCVLSSVLADRSLTGAFNGNGGQACDAGGACRSGLCSSVSNVCVDTCCTTATPGRMGPPQPMQCAGITSCRVGAFQGWATDMNFVARCAPTVGNFRNGDQCTSNSDCRSNLCVSDTTQFTCRDPCRRPEDCGGTMFQAQTCQYLQLTGTGAATSNALVAACVPLAPAAPGDGGAVDWAPCKTSNDCARGYCAQSGGGPNVCVSVCFTDGDCISTEKCQPEALLVSGTQYSVLACK